MRTHRPAAVDDAALLTGLANASARPYLGRDVLEEGYLAAMFGLPTVDLARDSRLLCVDDAVVAAAFVAAHHPFDLATVFVVVPPHHARESIANWAIDAAAALVAGHGDLRPDTKLLFEGLPTNDELIATLLSQRDAKALYSACDMSRELIDITEPRWPDGVHVTTLPVDDGLKLQRIAETNRLAFVDHDGDAAMPAENFLHFVASAPWVIPDLSLVAWDDEQPVGLALNGADPLAGERVGYVGNLGVLPQARGRGLGRALLLGSFAAMRDAGYTSATLHVEIDNRTGADRLYRSVGMTASDWSTTTWGITRADFVGSAHPSS